MELDTHFISESIAPYSSYGIGVYKKGGEMVGRVPIGKLTLPADAGRKLYSFGAVSDIHLGSAMSGNASDDFRIALEYFNQVEKVDFICVCGDLTNFGTVSEFRNYKAHVDAFSPNTPVYAVSGNHDANDNYYQASTGAITKDFNGLVPYTGKPLYYTFEQCNDLFVMMGMYRWDYGYANEDIFTDEELSWLSDTLAANTHKRIFLFQHALRFDGCGKPYSGSPTTDMLKVERGETFKNIVSAYPNVIWFHGHSHMTFDSVEDSDMANYDNKHGCHSVHIPSLATPREYENSEYVVKSAESEGYVVDVYENCVVLRGRNFVTGQFFSMVNYCIET